MNLVSLNQDVCNGSSNEIRKHLEELNDYDNKINERLLKKINKIENENGLLTESNKTAEICLKKLKVILKNVRVDANNWKKKCNKLELKNKDLLVKIQSAKEVCDNNDVAKFNEIPKKKSKITKENNYCIDISSSSYFTNEG